jgi:phage baseplate assembly protein W
LTRNYERPFEPDFGSQIYQLLFSLWTPLTKLSFVRILEDAVENYEPRVKIQSVDLQDNSINNAIDITINYIIRNINIPGTVSLTIERIR